MLLTHIRCNGSLIIIYSLLLLVLLQVLNEKRVKQFSRISRKGKQLEKNIPSKITGHNRDKQSFSPTYDLNLGST